MTHEELDYSQETNLKALRELMNQHPNEAHEEIILPELDEIQELLFLSIPD